ncbi:AsnC family transcriptional regulator [Nocardiopsis composta]
MHEFDLSLINALQLTPRAAWSDLAPILDVDATTLARRWRRLEEAGLARITVFPVSS